MAWLSFKWFVLILFPFQLFNHLEMPVATTKQVPHPFYVSVIEINHNAKDKALEVSCKVFVDDMEEVLKQNYKAKVDLTDAKQQAQNDKLITDYIAKHLMFIADGKPVKLNYIGFEKEAESVYCYFEVPNVTTLRKLDVTNSLLQDFNNTQINIMHVIVNGSRKSYKLDYPNKQASFSF